MKLNNLIQQFLQESDVQKQSLGLYEFCIKKYFMWVFAVKKDPEKLQRKDIIEYKSYLQSSGIATATIRNYYTVVRLFYKWMEINNHSDNITLGIRLPKYDNSYKKYPLTSDQVKELMVRIDRSTVVGARDYAIISLMVNNGLRRNEVRTIDIGDITTKQGTDGIFIQGKGRITKDQFVQITDTTMEAIHDYLLFRNDIKEADPLFISTQGSTKGSRLGNTSLSIMIKNRLASIGLTGKYYTCHSLRHTSACLLLDAGFDLHKVQLFLRHNSPSTTQLYTRMVDDQIRLNNEAGKAIEKLIKRDDKL